MKHIIFFLLLISGIFGCSSKNHVTEMSKTYEPVLEQDAQVQRVIVMINADEKLDKDKKNALVALVKEQSEKITKMREEQSQLRAVLVDQLLESADGSSSEALATSKKMEALSKKNIKGMKDFIIKFQSISGERDASQNAFMREVSNIHFL